MTATVECNEILERVRERVHAMYASFLGCCECFLTEDILTIRGDKAAINRINNERITQALIEESGAKRVVFEARTEENAMDELSQAKERIAKLEADADEYKRLLHDRENALSMFREENEKRLYEIEKLRGKVEVYEKVLDCVKAFGGGCA